MGAAGGTSEGAHTTIAHQTGTHEADCHGIGQGESWVQISIRLLSKALRGEGDSRCICGALNIEGLGEQRVSKELDKGI